jgi:hypothetical protein
MLLGLRKIIVDRCGADARMLDLVLLASHTFAPIDDDLPGFWRKSRPAAPLPEERSRRPRLPKGLGALERGLTGVDPSLAGGVEVLELVPILEAVHLPPVRVEEPIF